MKRNLVKRLLAFGLASALLLSACGSSSSSDADQDSDADTDTEADADSDADADADADDVVELEEKTIQMWMIGPGEQTDSDMVWEAWNELLQEYVPNTTVEWTIISGDQYKDSFNRMLAAGEAVDLAWVGYATDLTTDIADGNLLVMDEWIDLYGSNIVAGNGVDAMDATRTDGDLYYAFAWQGVVGGPTGIYIPEVITDAAGGQDWIDEVQSAVNTTITEPTIENAEAFYDAFATGMENLVDADMIYGGIDYRGNITFTFTYGYDFAEMTGIKTTNTGIYLTDDTFTVVDLLDSEFVKLKYATMAEYYESGYFRSDIASLTQTWITDGVLDIDDQIIFAHNTYSNEAAAERTAIQGMETIVIRKNDMFWIQKQTGGMAVPYSADEPERAVMVLDAIYEYADLYQMLIYGIEGTHYTDNGDGTITTGYGSQGNAEAAYGLWKWTIGTCMNSLVTEADTAGYYDTLKAYEEDAYYSPFTTFTFDTTEVSAMYSALTAVDLEYSPMLEPGYLGTDGWEDKYDAWMAARAANGLEDFIAEYQNQVDAFVEENNITSWNYEYKAADRG